MGGSNADHQQPIRREAERYGIPIQPAPALHSARWFTGGELRDGLPVPLEALGDLERVIAAIGSAATARSEGGDGAGHDVPVADWLGTAPQPAATSSTAGSA